MDRIVDRGALRVYRQNLLLAPNLSTTTLSNVNLTVYSPFQESDSALMLLDGRWKAGRAAELRIPTLYP